jgi:hypothetical protein
MYYNKKSFIVIYEISLKFTLKKKSGLQIQKRIITFDLENLQPIF